MDVPTTILDQHYDTYAMLLQHMRTMRKVAIPSNEYNGFGFWMVESDVKRDILYQFNSPSVVFCERIGNYGHLP